MTIWQFNAAVKGYIKANTSKEKGAFESEEEKEAIFQFAISNDKPVLVNATNIVYLWDGKNFNVEKRVSFLTNKVSAKQPKNLKDMFKPKGDDTKWR